MLAEVLPLKRVLFSFSCGYHQHTNVLYLQNFYFCIIQSLLLRHSHRETPTAQLYASETFQLFCVDLIARLRRLRSTRVRLYIVFRHSPREIKTTQLYASETLHCFASFSSRDPDGSALRERDFRLFHVDLCASLDDHVLRELEFYFASISARVRTAVFRSGWISPCRSLSLLFILGEILSAKLFT